MTFNEISTTWPLLGMLQGLPLLAALLLTRLRGTPAVALSSAAAILEMVLAVVLYLQFDKAAPAGVMQFGERFTLLGAFQYHAAVDGIGVLFVLLAGVLGFLSVTFILIRGLHGTSVLAVIMGIQATVVSQFVTVDLLWFTLMSAVEVLLVAHITKRWPTYDDIQPTLARYLQFMLVGLLLLVFGALLLGWSYANAHQNQWSFSVYDLVNLHLPKTLGTLVFFALFYGLGVRIPLFPLHGWLPGFMLHGNVAVAPIYLLGLKVGVYGLLRFVLPVVPEAVWEWHRVATGFAVTGVFYAAFLAMRQKTLREMLAFAVISHTGIMTVGLFSLHPAALQGSVLLALDFGLAISGLLLMTGMVWQRTHTTRLAKLGGLLNYIPMIGLAFLVAGLAIVGMPGTPGFDAVHFVLEGSIKRFGALVTIAAALGNLVAAGFLLRSFQRAFLSQPGGDTSRWDMNPTYLTEKIMAMTVMVVIVGVGFISAPWVELVEQPIHGLSSIFAPLAHDKEEGAH